MLVPAASSAAFTSGDEMAAVKGWYDDHSWSPDAASKTEEQKYMWGQLGAYSKLRSTIKANHPERVAA